MSTILNMAEGELRLDRCVAVKGALMKIRITTAPDAAAFVIMTPVQMKKLERSLAKLHATITKKGGSK